MNKGKTLIYNTFILAFGTVLPKTATFLILPILTASLTKEEYGTYDLILSTISLVVPIFSLLIEQAVFRFLLDAEGEVNKRKIITNSTIFVFSSSIFLFLLSMLILNQFNVEFSILVSLFIVINLYYKYAIQICRGFGQLKRFSLSSIINSILNLLLIYVFVGEIDSGLFGLLVSLNLSILVATVYALYGSKLFILFSLKYFDIKYIKELLIYSIPLLPNSLSWWVVGASDRWIITAFLGVEMTAIYAIANKIPSMFNLIYNNFNLAWQESATITSKDSDVDEYYSSIFNYLFNVLVGVLLVLITVSPALFDIFINDSYNDAYYQMPILFFAMFFNSLSAFYGGIYVALKNTKGISISSLIAAFLNVVINLLLISKIGLYAASLSTLLSYLVLTLYRAIDLQKKHVKINYRLSEILTAYTFLICVAILSYLNDFYLNIFNFLLAVIFTVFLNKNLIKQLILIKSKKNSNN